MLSNLKFVEVDQLKLLKTCEFCMDHRLSEVKITTNNSHPKLLQLSFQEALLR